MNTAQHIPSSGRIVSRDVIDAGTARFLALIASQRRNRSQAR
jgi:hypothetical protein